MLNHDSNIHADLIRDLRAELKRKVKGNDATTERMLAALAADITVLLHAVPGTGKTLAAATIARMIEGASFGRIQGAPDLTPGDITGVPYLDNQKQWQMKKGLIIGHHVVLGDEINRCVPKTLSAMLSALQERQVDVFGQRIMLENPFWFIATMNPVEQEGTFPLPEAFYDRIGIQLDVSYVGEDDEVAILRDVSLHGRGATDDVKAVMSLAELIEIRSIVDDLVSNTAEAVLRYIAKIVRATRPEQAPREVCRQILLGGSPRGQISILRTAAGLAFLNQDQNVTPDHVKAVAMDALRHRVFLTQEAKFDGVTSPEAVIQHVLNYVAVH